MNHMKLGGERCRAVGLSPEIINMSEADTVHLGAGNSLIADNKRGCENLTGSVTTARYQKELRGTWEAQSVSQKSGISVNKPINGKETQMTFWDSYQSIVSEKPRKRGGEKGLAAMPWGDRGTSSAHRGGHKKSTKLSSLNVRARENSRLRFTSLVHLITVEFLKGCFRELKRDKATGVDGVKVEEYEVKLEENLKGLLESMNLKRYRPKPARRTYIPKPKGGKRPLGISTIEDKVVQMALKKILEAIYEADFLDVSYGFRPKRNCHQALEVLDKTVMTKPVNYIVDMDIEKYYDTVDHKMLMKCLKVRIADPNLLRLIGRFLKAGVIEEGKYYHTDKGTSQGSIMSPVLSNIYLHYCLDLWFEKVVKKRNIGFSRLIRYSDDYVVCFQKVADARKFGKELRERLNKFGLKISEEKSQIIPFGRYPYLYAESKGRKLATFTFLGFTHYCTKTRKGYFRVGRKTSKVKFRLRIKELNEWLKAVRNQTKLDNWWKILRLKLLGHYRYYGISGNMVEMKAFYKRAVRLAHKWINRRSQKKSYNWVQFKKYFIYNPLPVPKIYHKTYTLSSKQTKQRGVIEEPYAGNQHVRFCEGC